MASAVKVRQVTRRRRGTTRISSKNQVTLPVDALKEAGLQPGTELSVKPAGPGRLVLERSDDPIERFAGMFTGLYPKDYLKKLRREWRY